MEGIQGSTRTDKTSVFSSSLTGHGVSFLTRLTTRCDLSPSYGEPRLYFC